MSYEYKVVPAPTRGLKAKGVKTAEDRFANALQAAMNKLASDGWEYQRADTLPSEQREGLLRTTTVYQNMLVLRRSKEPARPAVQPPEPPVASLRPMTGEERLAEKQRLATPKPISTPKVDKDGDSDKKPEAAAE